MKYGSIFWGLMLITIGVLFALRNFDLFFFSWGSLLRLWPLIFVFWGISILPVKDIIKFLLTLVFVIIGVIILVNNPGTSYGWFNWWPNKYDHKIHSGNDDHPIDDQYLSEDFNPDTEFAVFNFDAAAGDFKIRGVTSRLFEMESEGNTGPYSATTQNTSDNTVTINFEHKNFRGRANIENMVHIHLNENPVWTMNLDVGAADLDIDVTPFNVEKIDIDGGASSINLKIGTRAKKTIVNIDAGISGITIKVPLESACEVKASTILSGRDIDGFNKISGGLYQTPNFSDTANQVIIEVDAAISGVKIDRY
jgi:energy-coupling factor transporter transmembrane protein EcfT